MIFLPFYSPSWILLCCLDEIFTMTLAPFLCNLSSVCLEMFRSSGAENPLLQPSICWGLLFTLVCVVGDSLYEVVQWLYSFKTRNPL